MKLLITGSTGFLGKATVNAAVEAGHTVRAMYRDEVTMRKAGFDTLPHVEPVLTDLRNADTLKSKMLGVDAVIHLAGSMTGGLAKMRTTFVDGTRRLIEAMSEAGVDRLALVSSLSVYNYRALKAGEILDESTPLETEPLFRDAYCVTKLEQEKLACAAVEEHNLRLTVLRPGVVVGREHTWTSRLGTGLPAGCWLIIGGGATLPLSYVDNVADALVLTVSSHTAIGETYNIVDDDLPTQRQYISMLQENEYSVPSILLTVPLGLISSLAGLATGINTMIGGKIPLPGVLRSRALAARVKPLRYSNHKIKLELGWSPVVKIADGLRQSVGHVPTSSLVSFNGTDSKSMTS